MHEDGGEIQRGEHRLKVTTNDLRLVHKVCIYYLLAILFNIIKIFDILDGGHLPFSDCMCSLSQILSKRRKFISAHLLVNARLCLVPSLSRIIREMLFIILFNRFLCRKIQLKQKLHVPIKEESNYFD